MNIIITGASKGIGLAIAKTFAKQHEKHAIGICSRKKDSLESAEKELRAISSTHEYFSGVCDVSQEKEVNEFVAGFEKKFGAIDVLINNAGFGIFKPVLEISKHEFESVLNTNLRGVFLCTRAALPKMREKRSGTVISISSLAGKNGFSGGTAYCASKFAVRGLMQCLFLEVRSDNIRFVTICPGSVDTDFFTEESHGSSIKSKKALMAQDIAACIELAVSLPQNADISEMDVRPTNPKG
jgi:3-oxoacyl-[acyl-carrier protein] reductase